MAKLETLQTRIANTQKNIAKLEKRIIKLENKVEKDHYDEYDIKCGKKELAEMLIKLADYDKQLVVAINEQQVQKVQAIVEFLQMWRAQAVEYYTKQCELYQALRRRHTEELKDLKGQEYRTRYYEQKNELKAFTQAVMAVSKYSAPYVNMDELNKLLDREVEHKYKDFVQRIQATVGTIENADHLRVGGNGSINGIVKGSDGECSVYTILAGGYNIQCLHYRVLVKKL